MTRKKAAKAGTKNPAPKLTEPFVFRRALRRIAQESGQFTVTLSGPGAAKSTVKLSEEDSIRLMIFAGANECSVSEMIAKAITYAINVDEKSPAMVCPSEDFIAGFMFSMRGKEENPMTARRL